MPNGPVNDYTEDETEEEHHAEARLAHAIRLTPEADYLWLEIGTRRGLNKKGALETLLREKGRQLGIEISKDRTGQESLSDRESAIFDWIVEDRTSGEVPEWPGRG